MGLTHRAQLKCQETVFLMFKLGTSWQKSRTLFHNLNTSVTLTKHHYLTPWKKEQVGFMQISLCGIIY